MEERDATSVFQLMKALAQHEGQSEYLKIDLDTFKSHAFKDQPSLGAVVAEQHGQLIGYVSYTINFSIWLGAAYMQVDDVYVMPDFRSAGVGRQLMQGVKEDAKRLKLPLIRWGVEKDNVKAIAFYKRLGATYKEKGLCNWYI